VLPGHGLTHRSTPTRYGWLRQPSRAGELKRWAAVSKGVLPFAQNPVPQGGYGRGDVYRMRDLHSIKGSHAIGRCSGAPLLLLLGIGIFPFNTRALFTGGGMLLAGMACALLFFAYRLATHKAQVPRVPGAEPAGQQQDPTAVASSPTSEFVLSPSTPDVTKCKPLSGFMIGSRMIMFFKDPRPIGATQAGIDLPLRYLFAASVFNGTSRQMERVYTVETGFTPEAFFCAFERSGTHVNLGSGAPVANQQSFESAVLKLLCEEHGVSRHDARPLPV